MAAPMPAAWLKPRRTDLALGTTYHGQLAGSGQSTIVPRSRVQRYPMLVSLDDTFSTDQNELYVKFGSAPTRADYDYRFSAAATADQQSWCRWQTLERGTFWSTVIMCLRPATIRCWPQRRRFSWRA